MSKIKLICFICISLLFFGTSVQANLRSSQNDFTTKSRKEKLIGGGPGQRANVLMAVGQGLNFDAEVIIIQTGYPSHKPPSPEPPLPEPPLPEPPLPEPPLPLTTLPMT
jgi:hypothetical protein